MAKKSGKSALKKEIVNLKKRLKTFTSHTGFTYDIDEKYFLSLNQPTSKIIKRLKKIRWNNAANIVSYKGIQVTAHGKYKNVKSNIPLTNKETSQLTHAIKKREKVTGEVLPANVQSKGAIQSVTKFYKKLDTKEKAKAWKKARDTRAINNLVQDVRDLANVTGKQGYDLLADFLEDKLTVTNLRAHYTRDKWEKLTKEIGFNIFDSDTWEEIRSGGRTTRVAILEFLGLSEQDLSDYAYSHYDEQTVFNMLDDIEISKKEE